MLASQLLNGLKTVGITCSQWGDTGKGKIVDYFAAEWADIVARGTGSANAGHTISIKGTEYVFHLIPCGILHDKINIIGSGVAIDPAGLIEELIMLDAGRISTEKLRISLKAHLVLPQHLVLDRVREVEAKKNGTELGTTGRGVGPVFADHVARVGLVINDLLNPDVFIRKLRRNLEDKTRILRTYDAEMVRDIMQHKMLSQGLFYRAKDFFDVDAIADRYIGFGKILRPFIADTDSILQKTVGKSHILLEGAQGNMLSVDYGTYPFVTSSDCSIQGLAKGVGLRERDIDLSLGIVKAFYMTRVGEGPFPTELGGEASARQCRTSTRASEAEKYPDASLNDSDEFVRGVALRRIGHEYGATTGRPRRTGWLDLPLLRYSRLITGDANVILTKLDVMDDTESFKVCDSYEYQGPDYIRGSHTVRTGDKLTTAIPDLEVMRHCKPNYFEFPGWKGPIRDIKKFETLPLNLQQAIRAVEVRADVNVTLVSVGPDREETIFVNPPRRK